MEIICNIEEYDVIRLSKDIAKKHISELIEIICQIPLVDYSCEQIMAEKKETRIFFGKWKHSLAMIHNNKIIGVIIGYERQSEMNKRYPENTVYISEFGINKEYQKRGLGKKLIRVFIGYNKKMGFKHLEGVLNFSVQTNSANWNQHVIDLYKSFGFQPRAKKEYDNRIDVVLGLYPD